MIAGAALVLILGLYMITFQVQFNQVAITRTFGKITPPDSSTGESPDVVTDPGLKWKWPWPIQRVTVYDNRIHVSQTTGEETPTRDLKNVIVTTTIGWRIDDPYTFDINNTGLDDAEEKLKTRVRNDQKTVIAQYEFTNFVSTDPDELKYEEIERGLLRTVSESTADKQSVAELYGIKVEFIGIEQLTLPSRITESVFSAMQQERKAQAARYTSEGEAKAKSIKSEAESIANTIISFADARAEEIIDIGKRRSAEYNAVFREDESLQEFLLEIDYLGQILKERVTVLLKGEPPFDLLGSGGRSTAPLATRPADDAARAAANVALPEMLSR
jgi:membrane protease subunit HflC